MAAWFFHGNLRLACGFLREGRYMLRMLAESRFNRRLHRIALEDWQGVLTLLAGLSPQSEFVLDSCPVPVCRGARSRRRRLYPHPQQGRKGDAYTGYCAAKEEWYTGLKAHVVVDKRGRPVEVLLLCASSADLTGMKEMTLALPEGARVYADKAYTHYAWEQQLQDEKNLLLLPIRKSNTKRPHTEELAAHISRVRKRIETTFSQINTLLARRIAAVTEAGFESKIMAAFVAYAILGVAS